MIRKTLAWVAACAAGIGVLAGCEVIAGIETKELAAGAEGDGGVAAQPIKVGMTAALTGPSGALGVELRRGIDACFARKNKNGGISGRQLVLDVKDDKYDPATAEQNARALLDVTAVNPDPNAPDTRGPNSVIALIGNVGTPTMQKTLPVAAKNKTIFFAPFTGAQTPLRDASRPPYVFNYRAGYFEETRAIVARIKEDNGGVLPPLKNIIVFAQSDGYGDAGYNGMKAALAAEGQTELPLRINYTRDDLSSVTSAVTSATDAVTRDADKTKKVSLVMIDTPQIGSTFIKLYHDALKDPALAQDLRTAGATTRFIHVSFVGSEGLLDELKKPPNTYTVSGAVTLYSQNVFVSQVVPPPDARAPGTQEYRDSIAAFDKGRTGPTSFEGDLACRLFVAGLEKANGDYTGDNLVKAYESLGEVDFGIDVKLSFTKDKHQATDNVWISEIKLATNAQGTAETTYEFIERWDPLQGLRKIQ